MNEIKMLRIRIIKTIKSKHGKSYQASIMGEKLLGVIDVFKN